MRQSEHGEVTLSVYMGNSSCNNSLWLKTYQYLLPNSSKVALKGEIIMNLETK